MFATAQASRFAKKLYPMGSLSSLRYLSSQSEPLVISVELISDTLWPNGYIGKKHLNRAIREVLTSPLPNAPKPVTFSVLRVPFFLEPFYDENKPYIESNRERLIQKWGGKAGWERQKASHDLKGRGLEAGIPHFNLDRYALTKEMFLWLVVPCDITSSFGFLYYIPDGNWIFSCDFYY